LTLEEFGGFQNPEHADHMHQTLIQVSQDLIKQSFTEFDQVYTL
jgi:hypothetical protein